MTSRRARAPTRRIGEPALHPGHERVRNRPLAAELQRQQRATDRLVVRERGADPVDGRRRAGAARRGVPLQRQPAPRAAGRRQDADPRAAVRAEGPPAAAAAGAARAGRRRRAARRGRAGPSAHGSAGHRRGWSARDAQSMGARTMSERSPAARHEDQLERGGAVRRRIVDRALLARLRLGAGGPRRPRRALRPSAEDLDAAPRCRTRSSSPAAPSGFQTRMTRSLFSSARSTCSEASPTRTDSSEPTPIPVRTSPRGHATENGRLALRRSSPPSTCISAAMTYHPGSSSAIPASNGHEQIASGRHIHVHVPHRDVLGLPPDTDWMPARHDAHQVRVGVAAAQDERALHRGGEAVVAGLNQDRLTIVALGHLRSPAPTRRGTASCSAVSWSISTPIEAELQPGDVGVQLRRDAVHGGAQVRRVLDQVLGRQRLVRERHVHHRGGVALGRAEVHQPPLRQQEDAPAVRPCGTRPRTRAPAAPPTPCRPARPCRSRRRSGREFASTAPSFMTSKCSRREHVVSPVTVTKMSPIRAASRIGSTR